MKYDVAPLQKTAKDIPARRPLRRTEIRKAIAPLCCDPASQMKVADSYLTLHSQPLQIPNSLRANREHMHMHMHMLCCAESELDGMQIGD